MRTISCSGFLDAAGVPFQYADTLQKNVGVIGGFLNRDKLEKIRIHHLPQMNITQHDHMKAIIKQIKELRKATARNIRLEGDLPSTALEDLFKPPTIIKPPPSKIKAFDENGRLIDYAHQLGHKTGFVKAGNCRASLAASEANSNSRRLSHIAPMGQDMDLRRSSLGGNANYKPETNGPSRQQQGQTTQEANNNTNNEETAGSNGKAAAGGGGRGGFTFQNHDEKRLASARETRNISQGYGNQALRASTIEQGLKVLTKQVIDKFREVVGCDRATILYNDTSSDELVFFVDDQCIRFPNTSGIAGYCLQTGESLNIEEAYDDPRFNPEVDRKTGYRTRNILARPIYARFGGNIIAVVEMINKLDTGAFTRQDEEVLESCCLGVCDALESQFTDLLTSMTALNRHRKTANVLGSAITRDIKDLTALHDAFLAKLDGRVSHSGNDSRYMKLNEPTSQMTTDLQKRKRRAQYAENLRTLHQASLQEEPSSSSSTKHSSHASTR